MKRHIPKVHLIQVTFEYGNTRKIATYTMAILHTLLSDQFVTEIIDMETGELLLWLKQNGERHIAHVANLYAYKYKHARA